jgi:hypothetical protein
MPTPTPSPVPTLAPTPTITPIATLAPEPEPQPPAQYPWDSVLAWKGRLPPGMAAKGEILEINFSFANKSSGNEFADLKEEIFLKDASGNRYTPFMTGTTTGHTITIMTSDSSITWQAAYSYQIGFVIKQVTGVFELHYPGYPPLSLGNPLDSPFVWPTLTPTPAPTPTPEPEPQPQIGDTVTAGSTSANVLRAEQAHSISGSDIKINSKEGFILLEIIVELTNLAENSVELALALDNATVWDAQQEQHLLNSVGVLWKDKRYFVYGSSGEMSRASMDKSWRLTGDFTNHVWNIMLTPRSRVQIILVYSVPIGSSGFKLSLSDFVSISLEG